MNKPSMDIEIDTDIYRQDLKKDPDLYYNLGSILRLIGQIIF